MKITLDLLEDHDACEKQRDLFARLYPKGAELSAESLVLARAQGLDVQWLACLIPRLRRKEYKAAIAAAREVYEVALAPAREVYEVALAAAREVYEATLAAAQEVYEATLAAAREVYEVALAAARKVYEAASAAALVAAFD